MLVQIQTSLVTETANSAISRRSSITGQGIHTDGADVAAIVCIERDGVEGAENVFYADLQGKVALCDKTLLQPGTAAYFCDNRLYHYVSRADKQEGREEPGRRTVMILHSPGEMYLSGVANERNELGAVSREAVLATQRGGVGN